MASPQQKDETTMERFAHMGIALCSRRSVGRGSPQWARHPRFLAAGPTASLSDPLSCSLCKECHYLSYKIIVGAYQGNMFLYFCFMHTQAQCWELQPKSLLCKEQKHQRCFKEIQNYKEESLSGGKLQRIMRHRSSGVTWPALRGSGKASLKK